MTTIDSSCPFCVTDWKCNGPHIDSDDMKEFTSYVQDERFYAREQALDEAVQAVENLQCKCRSGKDYCDGQTDAIEAIEALVTTSGSKSQFYDQGVQEATSMILRYLKTHTRKDTIRYLQEEESHNHDHDS